MQVPTIALAREWDVAWQLVIAFAGSSEALQREITVMTAETTIVGLNLDGGYC